MNFSAAVLLSLWVSSITAQAATLSSFSPQGESASVRQVHATFSEPMVALGDPKAPAPFTIDCSEPGSGRWTDAKTWTYDFQRDVPPGISCRFTLKPGVKSAGGSALVGRAQFGFTTGGPAVVRTDPWAGNDAIDEEQVFVTVWNGAPTEGSVRANAWCEAETLGNRIPIDLVGGNERETLVKQLRLAALAERTLLLRCRARLPNGAKASLVLGPGVATPSGLATTREQRFAYTVRRSFEATFTCERENANAPCVPIRPVALEFSAPIALSVANEIRLETARGALKPQWPAGSGATSVQRVEFAPPLPEASDATLTLPKNLSDDAGRTLANAASFPLRVRIGAAPPLVKFPGTFGVVEAGADAMLPVTVRGLDPKPSTPSGGLALASLRIDGDAEAIKWLRALHGRGFDFERPEGCLTPEEEAEAKKRGEKPRQPADCRQAREVSLLAADSRVERRTLPLPEAGRPFEVVGIPFPRPGYYVVEAESPALGAALLGRAAPMYVRASVLVTNLAVHFKRGRDNALVWVTRLDTGKPVDGADIRVSDCLGKELYRGRTDRAGLARLAEAPAARGACQPRAHEEWSEPALFVSARSGDDFAFVLSNWNDGIERWRFGVPTAESGDTALRAHTVFDRTLLRAGETVSMKHFIRREMLDGFAHVDRRELPSRVLIRHVGSEEQFERPLAWDKGAAETQYAIPRTARLGEYAVVLESDTARGQRDEPAPRENGESARSEPLQLETGSFRVAEFRLPVMEGRLSAPPAAQVAVREVPFEIQLNYVSGGPASGHELSISAVTRPREVSFAGYEGFRFALAERRDDGDDVPREKLVADRIATKLDRNGAGRVTIGDLAPAPGPRLLRTEATFADPNGERLTIAASTALWPAAVVVGIRTDSWVAVGKRVGATLVVLDTAGKPVAEAPVRVRGEAQTTISHRRRLVGGFYAYEHRTERKALGELCSAKSDARGLVSCEIDIDRPGNVMLIAEATDANGNVARADASIWITDKGEVWFESESQDRMDVVPEKRRYEPGETARLQLRMPFRDATVLVSVERSGVVESFVREVSGRNPTVEVPIRAEYGPNVYVSALAVRGRLREVPWYSAFTWGWRAPLEWWRAWREWRERRNPGAMVDLAKPAFKYGLTELQVGVASRELRVSVTPSRPTWRVRERASVKVQVRMPDGKPAPAGSEVAFAAVDQALLELQPNLSWKLLDAMYQRRAYGVETATAQMQVIGRRHYGRKAVTHGGGGGRNPTRELFDTLLVWKPRVVLDGNGEALIDVPINDSLTRFALVAVADVGAAYFGSGAGSLDVTQDLQIISALPPMVRAGDAYRAAVTLRNTTARAMRVRVDARAGDEALAPQTIELPASAAREAAWAVNVASDVQPGSIRWEIAAREEQAPRDSESAQDTLRIVQHRVPLVPVTVQQANLVQLAPGARADVAPPADALPGTAAIRVALAPRLAVAPAAVRAYFDAYPLACLEQRVSRAIGLGDRAAWTRIVGEMAAYIDGDGLARYFPGEQPGSDTLTAYLLAVSNESGFALPEALSRRMAAGLAAFVEGRIQRDVWSPRADVDVRKLAAVEALSRYGRASPRQLQSIAIEPNAWPTGALIDWIAILNRMPSLPNRDAQRQRAEQLLRARLDYSGTRLAFSTEAQDEWWWLMTNADANGARLILAELDASQWRNEMPRLVSGLIGRQVRGRWTTTTANAWGTLALQKFSREFEKAAVSGLTEAKLDDGALGRATLDWAMSPSGATLSLPWSATPSRPTAALAVAHAGSGSPWATIQTLAAVPLKAAQAAGFDVTRTVVPLEQKERGALSRGDVVRVRLDIDARADMTWVVVSDPVPAGASILGTGLGRDSAIATRGERRGGRALPAFEEKGLETYRAYYEYVPKGKWSVEYTLRLNSEGRFGLPPTRVEAMYAPDMHGELPNAAMTVKP